MKGVKKEIFNCIRDNNFNIKCQMTSKMTKNMCVIIPRKRLIRIKNDWARNHRDEILALLKICYNHINENREISIYLENI